MNNIGHCFHNRDTCNTYINYCSEFVVSPEISECILRNTYLITFIIKEFYNTIYFFGIILIYPIIYFLTNLILRKKHKQLIYFNDKIEVKVM